MGLSPILHIQGILGYPIMGFKNKNEIKIFIIEGDRVSGILHGIDSDCRGARLLRPLCMWCLLTQAHSGVVDLGHVRVVK